MPDSEYTVKSDSETAQESITDTRVYISSHLCYRDSRMIQLLSKPQNTTIRNSTSSSCTQNGERGCHAYLLLLVGPLLHPAGGVQPEELALVLLLLPVRVGLAGLLGGAAHELGHGGRLHGLPGGGAVVLLHGRHLAAGSGSTVCGRWCNK